METSPTDPKVRFDGTGLYVTDAAGNKVTLLSVLGLSMLTTANYAQQKSVTWTALSTGAVVADIQGRSEDLGGVPQGGTMAASAYQPAQGKTATASLAANYTKVSGSGGSAVRAMHNETTPGTIVTSQVDVFAGLKGAMLLNFNDESDYVRGRGEMGPSPLGGKRFIRAGGSAGVAGLGVGGIVNINAVQVLPVGAVPTYIRVYPSVHNNGSAEGLNVSVVYNGGNPYTVSFWCRNNGGAPCNFSIDWFCIADV
jgi:hypothetical protein